MSSPSSFSQHFFSISQRIAFTFFSFSKKLRIFFCTCFAIFCLTFFTVLKLPEDQMSCILKQYLDAALGTQALSISFTESHFSIFTGIHYTLKNPVLSNSVTQEKLYLEEIDISPKILSLFLLRLGANLKIVFDKNSYLHLSGSFRNTLFSTSFEARQVEFSKLKALPLLKTPNLAFKFSGNGRLKGSTSDLTTWDGRIALQLSDIVLESQMIEGFHIPKIAISTSVFHCVIEKSKVSFKDAQLGLIKNNTLSGPSDPLFVDVRDDITGSVKGFMSLGKSWSTSYLDLKLVFSFSDELMKSFLLIDTLLKPGKQSDGRYAYDLKGSTESPDFHPTLLTESPPT